MNDLTLIQKYVLVRERIAELEEIKLKLEMEVFDIIDESGESGISTEFGSFKSMSRTTYDYSGAVLKAQEELRQLKKKEEINKVATVKSVSRYIRFDPPKND